MIFSENRYPLFGIMLGPPRQVARQFSIVAEPLLRSLPERHEAEQVEPRGLAGVWPGHISVDGGGSRQRIAPI